MFPCYIFKGDKAYPLVEGKEEVDLEKIGIGYAIGSNGLFLINNNVGHEIIRPTKEVAGLSELKTTATYHYPKISYNVYKLALEFLRQVFKEYDSEGNILLLLDRSKSLDEQEYTMYVPEQTVTGGSVVYKIDQSKIPENFFQAGSIHSHPNFSAFQSGTDHKDEFCFDGIHITLGQINRDNPEVHGRLILAGSKYENGEDGKTPLKLIATIPESEETKIPEDWMKQVSKISNNVTYLNNRATIQHYHSSYNKGQKYSSNSSRCASTVRNIIKTMKPKNVINQSNAIKIKDIVPFETVNQIGFESDII